MKQWSPATCSVSLVVIFALVPSQCRAQSNLPSITRGGVVSASAFGQFTSIAPGSWIEIYGSNLASTMRSWGGSDFSGSNAPTSLDGTKVTVGGQPAFIDYVSPGQVNAQVPSNVVTGSQPIVVTTPSGPSAPYTITVNATQPGLLAPSAFKIGNTQYAAALFADGKTFVLPPGAIPGLASRRAQPGDTITLYGVGFGVVVPSIPAGQVVGQNNTLASNLQINFGTTPGLLTYSGLAPSNVGLYQFNVVVPAIPSSDSVPLTFTLSGVAGTQTLNLAVQNGASTGTFSRLVLGPVTYAPSGYPSGMVTWTFVPDNGQTTFSTMILNGSGPYFVNCTTSNGNLTFSCNSLAAPPVFNDGATTLSPTSASLMFTLAPSTSAFPYAGTVTGTLNMTGTTLDPATLQPKTITLSGPLTGNYDTVP